MTGPAALTAAAIAELAFKKFMETAAGELAKQFTQTALTKMDELRQKVVARIKGVAPVDNAVAKLEGNNGNENDLETVADYLKIAMREDPTFADELKQMAEFINNGKIQDNSQMIQNNSDNATGFMGKAEQGSKLYQATSITINEAPSQD